MENKNKEVPVDMQIEILLRMPLKSLLKCICVSKKWSSIIQSKHFKHLYLLRSMTRPRVLFGFFPVLPFTPERDAMFHSVYQEEKPLLSSGEQHVSFLSKPTYSISEPIRGLVCFQAGNEAVICNPGTRKYVTLPDIQARNEVNVSKLFLGYDEASDVFKVLCVTKTETYGSERAQEHQVLTIGSGEESWRTITCTFSHSPTTEARYKGGDLYYVARTENEKCSLIKFNVESEKFSCIQLPECQLSRIWKLVKYKGEIAAVSSFNDLRYNVSMDIWVLDVDAGKLNRVDVAIPCWKETFGDMMLSFQGTIGTGELVFAPEILLDNLFSVMYYNTDTKVLRRFEIEGMAECEYGCVQTYLDHYDSLLLT